MGCIFIIFKILVFYKTEEALDQYLSHFRILNYIPQKYSRINERMYENEYYQIQCIRGIPERARGCRADIIAVQEDLTWTDHWDDICHGILGRMLTSPIDIQIFDGIDKEDIINREGLA